jgi:hypothetical protein
VQPSMFSSRNSIYAHSRPKATLLARVRGEGSIDLVSLTICLSAPTSNRPDAAFFAALWALPKNTVGKVAPKLHPKRTHAPHHIGRKGAPAKYGTEHPNEDGRSAQQTDQVRLPRLQQRLDESIAGERETVSGAHV